MNLKFALSAVALGCVFVSLPACTAEVPQDEADAEETGASQDELSANASRFVGAYQQGTGGARPPTFEGLVFKIDGTFFGDVDTGIRCVRAPCPSSAHLEGRFSATKNYLRLTPKAGTTGGYYGRYQYKLIGDKLSLTRADFAGWTNTLEKALSYCAQASDCGEQGLIHPMCVGAFTCGVTKANTCGYKCGLPAPAIWPADASKLVAESPGGGFAPPPPPGSTCAIGRQKYSLDRATRALTWETCAWNGSGAPLHLVTGSKTITAAQLAKVNQAMGDVAVATHDMCGADKPFLSIKVTSPAGEKTYTDSFYKCQGGNRTYVDNIDAVFGALRNAAE